MPVFLTIIGILLGVIGLFAIGFSIPIRDFSLGSTLIVAGSVSIVGGLIVIGLGATIRELRKLVAKAPEKIASASRPASPAPSPTAVRSGVSAPIPVPVRPAPKPAVVNTTRSQRTEPRLGTPPESSIGESPATNAPTAGELGNEGPRAGLFASIRGRAAVAAAIDSGNPPSPLPPQHDDLDPHPFARDHDAPPESVAPSRSPSLSALAARTAARLDLPRPVPDLPRVAPDHPLEEPVPFERPASTPPVGAPPERPTRNVFDTVWPGESKAPAEKLPDPDRRRASSSAEIPAPADASPEPRPLEILKSGVIDGMAYTLYTDGSIEAQLPQGTLRFSSIEDLRAHLEHHN